MVFKLGDFSKVPPKQKAILGVLFCVAVIMVYFYVYYKPLMVQKTALEKKVTELDGVIRVQSDIARNLPSFKVEVRRLEEQLGLLLEQLPNSAEIPSLLKNISDLGKESGLEFLKFAPGSEIRRDFYAMIPVSITVSGNYHSFVLFADKVRNLPRIVNLSDVSFGNPRADADNRVLVNIGCTATTYRFLEQAAQEAQATEKGKAK